MLNLSKPLTAKILLFFICLLFLLTRLYKIDQIPSSVYWDEASIGYNAYSILKTGKDEWGDFLPIHFRAFGEFKLPVYIYSVVPFVAVFGLDELSVRIPAVLYSLGVVILVYFLAKKITGFPSVGLWSSFLVCISPWFFIFSRTGFEATAGLMFYLLGIYLFLKQSKDYYIFFSVLSFILSAYSYNSFRIIIPLTFISLLLNQLFGWVSTNGAKVSGSSRWWILSGIAVIISFIPIYRLYIFDAGSFRLQSVAAASGIDVFRNYLSHFSPNFLFFQGDTNLRHQQQEFGQLYFIDAVFIAMGIFYLFLKRKRYTILLLSLLFLAPLPASITKESPHALRSIAAVPLISIIAAIGLNFLRDVRLKFLIVILLLGFFVNYYVNFLVNYPTQSRTAWQYNYKEIFTSLPSNSPAGKIFISDKEGQPYIFALFYLKYNPEKFKSEVVRNSPDKWGFSTVKEFGPYQFGD